MSSVPDAADLSQWWLDAQGKPSGPFPTEMVREQLRLGKVTTATLACPVAGQEWKPLHSWPTFQPPGAPSAGKLTAVAKGRSTVRRFARGPGRTSRSMLVALAAAFKLVGLGMLLGAVAGGGLFAWWWFGGFGDLPREGDYLPENTPIVFTARLAECRQDPFCVHVLKTCLVQATGKTYGAEWEKEFERTYGVPPHIVELLLLGGPAETEDWLLVLRTDRPWNAETVQQTRRTSRAAPDLKFAPHQVGGHVLFEETSSGKEPGPVFCVVGTYTLLFAKGKETLTSALERRKGPRFAASLQAAVAQANFSRDLALAVRLDAAKGEQLHAALLSGLDKHQPPGETWKSAEGMAWDYQRDRQQVRATLVCSNSFRAKDLQTKCQDWVELQRKAGKEDARSALLGAFSVVLQEKRVTLQGSLLAPQATPQPAERKEATSPAPTTKKE